MSFLAPHPPVTPAHSSSTTLGTDAPPPPTPTTDFAVFEAQKENIQPLHTGRSAAVLGGLYNKERVEAERVVREGHERCRAVIEEAERREGEGEEMVEGVADVLDPYCRYIAFINQHHPSSPSILLPVLESTTRKFILDPRFHQDARYLKLWSQYARLVEVARQEDVWVFLNSREVGTVWAGFYEDWAGCCEARGRRQEAEEIFKLGINRKAQPLKRLQQQYQAFLSRPPVIPPPSSSMSSSGLANTGVGQGAASLIGGRRVLGSRTPSSSSSGLPSGPASQTPTTNHSRLDVFCDSTGTSATGLPGSTDALPWADLGTRDGNRKENEREATGWRGEILKQDKRIMGKVAPRTPRLEVFSDEPEPRARPSNSDDSSAPGAKSKSTADAEALRSNPLRFYTELLPLPSASTSLPPIPGSSITGSKLSGANEISRVRKVSPTTGQHVIGAPWTVPERDPAPAGPKVKPEKRMFIWEEVYLNDEEWSFEEIRARAMGGSGGRMSPVEEWEMEWHLPGATGPAPPKPRCTTPPSEPLQVAVFSTSPAVPARTTMPPIASAQISVFSDSAPVPVRFESPASSPAPIRPGPALKQSYSGHRAPPSPTVNTKAAMADVMEMLNQDLKGGKGGARAASSEDDSEEESSSDEDDEDEDDDAKATRVHIPQPTPRAATSGPIQMRTGLSTPGAFVPPTPTPAQGFLANRRDPFLGVFQGETAQPPQSSIKLKVFQDESLDAVLPPSAPPSRMMTFSDENAAVHPRLSVFSDENAVPGPSSVREAVGETPARGRTPLGRKGPLTSRPIAADAHGSELESIDQDAPTHSQNDRAAAFATPVRPLQRGQGSRAPNIFAPAFASAEEEDEGAEGEQEPIEYQEEIDRPGRQRQVTALGRQFNTMTPITERTYEYTSSTIANGLRSSTSSALTAGTRNFTRLMDSDDEAEGRQTDQEEDRNVGPAIVKEPDLSMVREESENTGSTAQHQHNAMASPSPTVTSSASGRSQNGFERSGTIDSPFRLPKGYTIQSAHQLAESPQPRSALSSPPQQELVTPSAEERVSVYTPPNPCTPTDADVMAALLGALSPPLTDMVGFVDLRHEDANQLSALQKSAKSRGLSASTKSSAPEPWLLDLGSKRYEVEEKIGEGGFGAVFKAIDLEARDIADDASDCEDDGDMEDQFVVAVKVERPTNVWESVILDRLRARLSAVSAASVIKSRGLYCYRDESMLLLDYHSQGTLLDAVNKAQLLGIAPAAPGAIPSMDELPAIFFTIELLKIVEELHRADFIHGDLKIDNCLIRLANADTWLPTYDRTGGGGWSKKGVRLIDFGRAADMRMYPAGHRQQFVADWPTDERDCPEMRGGSPWSYQTDYCGLASICYCLLFGKYIATEEIKGPDSAQTRFKISGSLKRYWQTDLWTELFDLLLNSRTARPDGALPVVEELSAIRAKFEDWLEANCQKNGKNLKSMLSKIEMASMR